MKLLSRPKHGIPNHVVNGRRVEARDYSTRQSIHRIYLTKSEKARRKAAKTAMEKVRTDDRANVAHVLYLLSVASKYNKNASFFYDKEARQIIHHPETL